MKLLIDESLKPVAQHVPRIPCRLREKVNKKDDELLDLNIINRKYQSDHLVRVPKSDGVVGVCVDLGRANEGIARERHQFQRWKSFYTT